MLNNKLLTLNASVGPWKSSAMFRSFLSLAILIGVPGSLKDWKDFSTRLSRNDDNLTIAVKRSFFWYSFELNDLTKGSVRVFEVLQGFPYQIVQKQLQAKNYYGELSLKLVKS